MLRLLFRFFAMLHFSFFAVSLPLYFHALAIDAVTIIDAMPPPLLLIISYSHHFSLYADAVSLSRC